MFDRHFRRVSKRRPCEICRHHDWCTYTESAAFCMRVSSGSLSTSRNGAYMHRTSFGDRSEGAQPLPSDTQQLIASQEHLNLVYSSLLRLLSLSNSHKKHLLDRGLTEPAIDADLYRTAPQTNDLLSHIRHLDLVGMPGFFKREGEWAMVGVPVGILIPVRNVMNKICGLQIRIDDVGKGGRYIWFSSSRHPSGTSSGAPLHWSKPELLTTTKELLLTEGGLKANVISHFLDMPVVGAAGVRSFGAQFAVSLKAAHPHLTIVICFDSDWRSKQPVREALKTLQRQLTSAGVRWQVRSWPSEYKGYDDYLLAYSRIGVVA